MTPPHLPAEEADRGKALLDFLRNRNDHQRKIYLQHESRAQFVIGLLVAVGAGVLSAVGEDPLVATAGVMMKAILGLTAVVLTCVFALALAVIVPPFGRHYVSGDGLFSRLGLRHVRGTELGKYLPKPTSDGARSRRPELGALHEFIRARFANDADPTVLPKDIGKSEMYNLWSQWVTAERRAGLLRLMMIALIPAALLSGFAYYSVKVAVKAAAAMSRERAEAKLPTPTTCVCAPHPPAQPAPPAAPTAASVPPASGPGSADSPVPTAPILPPATTTRLGSPADPRSSTGTLAPAPAPRTRVLR